MAIEIIILSQTHYTLKFQFLCAVFRFRLHISSHGLLTHMVIPDRSDGQGCLNICSPSEYLGSLGSEFGTNEIICNWEVFIAMFVHKQVVLVSHNNIRRNRNPPHVQQEKPGLPVSKSLKTSIECLYHSTFPRHQGRHPIFCIFFGKSLAEAKTNCRALWPQSPASFRPVPCS